MMAMYLLMFSILIGVLSGLAVVMVFTLNPALFSPSLQEMPIPSASEAVMLILFFVTFFTLPSLIEDSVFKITGYWIFWWTLLTCCWADFKKKIVPNRVIYSGVIAVFFWLLYSHDSVFEGIFSALLVTSFAMVLGYLCRFFLGREAFGMGDIKLFLLICLVFGWEAYWLIYLSVLFGGFFSIAALLSNQLKRGEYIPFAPFLLAGVTIGVYILPWQTLTGWLYGY